MRTSLATWLLFQITKIWRDSKKKLCVLILLEDDITPVQGSNSKKHIYLQLLYTPSGPQDHSPSPKQIYH